MVREEITIDASEDNTREGIVLERSARDGLTATLKGHKRQWHKDSPIDLFFVCRRRRRKRHNGGSGSDEQCLGCERDAEDPAPFGGEESVEAGEEERSNTKAGKRNAGLVKPGRRGRIKQ